jgi:hypothetical protein
MVRGFLGCRFLQGPALFPDRFRGGAKNGYVIFHRRNPAKIEGPYVLCFKDPVHLRQGPSRFGTETYQSGHIGGTKFRFFDKAPDHGGRSIGIRGKKQDDRIGLQEYFLFFDFRADIEKFAVTAERFRYLLCRPQGITGTAEIIDFDQVIPLMW